MSLTLTVIIVLIIIGLLSGALSGMIGVGGGIIIVPALVFFLSFTQKEAQGTSLGILLLPVGILAVIQYYKQGQVDLRVVALVSLTFIIGSYFGSKLALSLPDKTLKKIFAVIIIFVALRMLFFDGSNKKQMPKKDNVEKIEDRSLEKKP